MIKIFGQTDKIYQSNGDIVVQPLKAKVHKEDNGEYYLSLETDLSYVDHLIEGNIIVANTPQGDQAFRITNPVKTRTKISTKAYHVFYDTKNYLIADSYVVDSDCNDALDHLNAATDTESPFATLSDNSTVNSYRCVRKSLYEAIMTVLERWGGHLVRDNFSITIREQIGVDNGVTVRYKKNLKDISCTEKWDDVVTKLLPVGKDGILLNEIDEEADIYVYSTQQYDIPYTKTVSFTQDGVNEDNYKNAQGETDVLAYKTALVEDLRQQAEEYVEQNSIPKVNYTLKANLEKITDIGDIIEVIDERLGINLLTNVISFTYDCILKKYSEVEFGNFKEKLSGLIPTITTNTEKTVNDKAIETVEIMLGDELAEATQKIWDALGNSYVIYEGDKILVVDSLPKETAVNVMMINSGGIGFSNNGINGTFNSAWLIDGTLDMQNINVVNLTADLIKGGVLKLGSMLNQSGKLELYDEANTLIGQMDRNGLKMFGTDGSYVIINNALGFAGFDRLGNKVYWADKDEFHMKKSVVESEITFCDSMRILPITLYDSNNNITSDGIGFVSVISGGT